MPPSSRGSCAVLNRSSREAAVRAHRWASRSSMPLIRYQQGLTKARFHDPAVDARMILMRCLAATLAQARLRPAASPDAVPAHGRQLAAGRAMPLGGWARSRHLPGIGPDPLGRVGRGNAAELRGRRVPEPRRFGLDLLMPIFFSAMLVPLW